MNKLLKIDQRLFVGIFVAFIGFTIVGTLSHEMGHFAAAHYFGLHPTINYMSSSPVGDEDGAFLSTVQMQYRNLILADQPFPGKERYDQLMDALVQGNFWILLGGPLQTLFTSIIGMVLLVLSYKEYAQKDTLSFKIWVYIFLALFWLRQSANLFVGLVFWAINGKFSMGGDEARLSHLMGLPLVTLNLITGLIGFVILASIVFKVIPRQQRITFLFAGFTGGVSGYILWLYILGPVVMP